MSQPPIRIEALARTPVVVEQRPRRPILIEQISVDAPPVTLIGGIPGRDGGTLTQEEIRALATEEVERERYDPTSIVNILLSERLKS